MQDMQAAEGRGTHAYAGQVGGLVASALGWVCGIALVVASLGAFLTPGDRVAGAFVLTAGALVVPPVTKLLRARAAWLRSWFAPPLLAFAAVVAATSLMGSEREQPRPALPPLSDSPARTSPPVQPRSRTSTIAEVQELIRQGTPSSTTAAMNRMNDVFGLAQINSDPELKALYAKATAAADASMLSDRAAAYAEQVEKQVQVLLARSAPAADAAAVWNRLSAFEEAARAIEEGAEFADLPAAATSRKQLEALLVERQTAELPALRRAYVKSLAAALWEQDVEVLASGDGAKSVRFVAVMFAANRNIASAQRAAEPHLKRLRFRAAQYEWYQGSKAWRYTLDTPSDAAIGYWSGGTFVKVR